MRLKLSLIACLLLFFWLATDTALSKSPTVDEPIHIMRGIKLWQTGGDMRFQLEHTPLSHWLNGILTAQEAGLQDVTELPGWNTNDRLAVSQALLVESGIDLGRIFFLARLPLIWLALIVGAVMLRWSGQWRGRNAALLTAVLFAVSPNLLAHGSLATTDFVATAGYLLAMYGIWRYMRTETWSGWAAAGLLMGVGIASKLTGALIAPIALILFLFKWPWRAALTRWASLIPLAGIVVWATYRFAFGPAPFFSESLFLPLPAPTYWESLSATLNHVDGGHKSFFMGEIRTEGWWTYFLVAWLIKTPLPIIGLSTAALSIAIWKKRLRAEMVLWFPALLLFLFATLSRLNIGYRHILPMIPLLIVWGAIHAAEFKLAFLPKAARVPLIIALLAGYGGFRLSQHPHHLPFFNLSIGGPSQGHLYLGDSNLDWGQDWLTAQRYVDRQGLTPDDVTIAPFSFIDVATYGFEQTLVQPDGFATAGFPVANPPAGLYLISVNPLQGLLAQSDLLDFFRRLDPTDQRATGYSIQAFEIEQQLEGDWIAHCTDPGPILEPQVAESLLGRAGVRHLYFDCRSGWVLPAGSGWVILPRDGTRWWPADLEGFRLIYSHEATTFAPSYEIYRMDEGLQALENRLPSAELDLSVAELASAGRLTPDTPWVTVWDVKEANGLPLSVMGHFYNDPAAPPTAVVDGLAFPTQQWQSGDRFIQFHPLPDGIPAATLQTTLYDFTTGEPITPPVSIDLMGR